jgi:hypothetical protein
MVALFVVIVMCPLPIRLEALDFPCLDQLSSPTFSQNLNTQDPPIFTDWLAVDLFSAKIKSSRWSSPEWRCCKTWGILADRGTVVSTQHRQAQRICGSEVFKVTPECVNDQYLEEMIAGLKCFYTA